MRPTIDELTGEICAFRNARDWRQFHNPKELAVAILLFELADNSGIDLAAAMRAKLARNEARYPVDKARGSNAKYIEL